MALKKIILSLIVTVAFCIVACSTFIRFEMDDNYFQLLPMSIGVVVVAIVAVFSCFLRKGNQGFHFIFSDFLFVIIVAYYAARYDYELQLANWKIIYAALLLLLWFAARIILSNLSISRSILLGGFVGIGCVLAIWGLLQLYGFEKSNHNLFPITGPFYNPGPYSGYIAMLFPIGFNQLLSSQGKIRYLWLFAFSIMIIILPAGMSRSAWLALLISCMCCLFIHKNWLCKIKSYACLHWEKTILLSILSVGLLIVFFLFLFQMKEDSANGRLFIWKNTYKAIQNQPLLGYGPGSFSMIYGR
jgi:O-antigen ligase